MSIVHGSHNPGQLSGDQENPGISIKSVLPDATFFKTSDLHVQSCCGRWNECDANDLYVALVDARNDGHEDAAAAIQRGATAVLCERMLPIDVPQCIVQDSRIAYGQICQALAGHPSAHLKTIGVAGSDGKTTTAHLVHSILDEAGLTAGLTTSLHNDLLIGEAQGYEGVAPPRLAQSIAEMVSGGNRFAVIESSSVALAQHQLSGFELDTAVLTNIRGANFQFHGNLANYQRAELRILDCLKPTGIAILNADDPTSYFLLNRLDTPAITVGIRQAAEVEGRIIHQGISEQTFMICAGSQSITIRSQMIGSHHIYNCLAATAVALTFDIDLPTIARGIERVSQLPGRLNSVRCGQAFHVAIDEAATPYRLGVALKTLKNNCRGKLICVFSTCQTQSGEIAGRFGRIAERSCDLPVITLNNNRQEIDYQPAHQILDGFDRPHKAQVIPDRIKAIEWALGEAAPGDVVLIAGRGHKPIASLSENRWQLTDQDVCESWLYGQATDRPFARASLQPRIFRVDDYRGC